MSFEVRTPADVQPLSEGLRVVETVESDVAERLTATRDAYKDMLTLVEHDPELLQLFFDLHRGGANMSIISQQIGALRTHHPEDARDNVRNFTFFLKLVAQNLIRNKQDEAESELESAA